jgi:RNA polymerase sigma factor (sigma-70 family)
MSAADTQRAVLAAWRIEQPRLITHLSRLLRDVPLAEELTQDALVAALERWPKDGVPERPGAWLMATAKRRALDHMRRRRMLDRKHAMVGRDLEAEQRRMPDFDAPLDDDIGDEMLRLIFTACHPILPTEARAALALRMICGLTTEEIARAFLVPEATLAQRIVRAKRTLSQSGLAYETPHGEALAERLGSVLSVIYLIFNEGYTAARGDDWLRPQLCSEALRLGRVLTAVAPQEPEAHGLLALMELNASRAPARTDANGDPILLLEQDRRLWDRLQIRRGMIALARAADLGGAKGFYALQAAIVACHAQAATRLALRRTVGHRRLARRRAQPRDRGRHGQGPGGRVGDRGSSRVRALTEGLPPAAQRPGRPAGKTRSSGGGACGVRGRRGARGKPARAGVSQAPRGGDAGSDCRS